MIQTLIVAAIVLFSLWQVARRWLFKPAVKSAETTDAGCGSSGCDTCGACKAIDFGPLTPRESR